MSKKIKDVWFGSNTAVTAGFSENAAHAVGKRIGKNLCKIHIMVFDPNTLNRERLIRLQEECRIGNVTAIIHCFDTTRRKQVRKLLKGVPKGKKFHTNIIQRHLAFRLSNDKTLFVHDGEIIITEHRESCDVQSIYKYKQSGTKE